MKNKIDEFVKNPRKSLLKLAFPMLIAMVVQVMYNIVDTAFVGRLGAEAIAALTFAFPLIFIVIALSSGIGAGMGSQISRFLGAKNRKAAENTALHGISLALITAVLLSSAGYVFINQILSLFGAEGNVLVLAAEYMKIILVSITFIFASFMLSQVFSSQGDTKTPMAIQISALVMNIILDPIFIYVLGYGVKGAAIATMISFVFSFVLAVYLIRKRSYLRLEKSSFSFSPWIIKKILAIGIPGSIMMLLLSFYMIFINLFMASFGTEYVAAFGISSRLESIVIMPMVALGLSLMTIVGMFSGARKYDLVKHIGNYGIRLAVMFSAAVGLIFFVAPSLFLRIFSSDQALIAIGAAYLRISVFSYPLMAIGMTISRIMQGMGYGMPGLVINLVRIMVVAVPLSYLFVFVMGYGYLSIAYAMVIGGACASTVAFVWLRAKLAVMTKS